MKRALALCAATGLLAVGFAPAAHAGEITGGKNPKPTPIKVGNKQGPVSASICGFSGLDDASEENAPSPDARPRVPQNWGQIPAPVRAILAAEGESPGQTCKFKLYSTGDDGAPA